MTRVLHDAAILVPLALAGCMPVLAGPGCPSPL